MLLPVSLLALGRAVARLLATALLGGLGLLAGGVEAAQGVVANVAKENGGESVRTEVRGQHPNELLEPPLVQLRLRGEARAAVQLTVNQLEEGNPGEQ